MDPFSPFRPNVPLVGQPIEAFEILTIVNFRCVCDPQNVPMLLTGVLHAKQCRRCGKAYAILSMHYDRAAGQPPSATVGVVVPAPVPRAADLVTPKGG